MEQMEWNLIQEGLIEDDNSNWTAILNFSGDLKMSIGNKNKGNFWDLRSYIQQDRL